MYDDILRVENINKEYKQGAIDVQALKDVSFGIGQGEMISVIGKSGSGKSTLLHIIGGLDRPTSGSVYINGNNLTAMAENKQCIFRRQNIGFVFQFFNLIAELNVKENIIFPVLLNKDIVDEEYIKELIDLLHLGDRQKHLPDQLSGGQQQRVAIARALALKPQIVLFDEPTGNLDEESSREVTDMIRLIQKRFNQTIIIVTHDSDIAGSADRIITLSNGRIVE